MVSFAFLRARRTDVERRLADDAPATPPFPFVEISQLATPNADDLAYLFLQLVRAPPADGSVGSAFFEACPIVEVGDSAVDVRLLPARFVHAIATLEDNEIAWVAACITFPVAASQTGVEAEIRGFRAFFRTSLEADERVFVWTDLR